MTIYVTIICVGSRKSFQPSVEEMFFVLVEDTFRGKAKEENDKRYKL